MSADTADLVRAPWTPEQVDNLNAWQAAGWLHPFTCGRCRDELGTSICGPGGEVVGTDDRVLVATVDGWKCGTCDYTQDWAHRRMVEQPPPPNPLPSPAGPIEPAPPADSTHTLVVGLRPDGAGSVLELTFTVSCPHAALGASRPCAVWLSEDGHDRDDACFYETFFGDYASDEYVRFLGDWSGVAIRLPVTLETTPEEPIEVRPAVAENGGPS